MIYFCADDYGVSKVSNCHIEECIKNGVLNKVSVLPNGETTEFVQRLQGENVVLSLHLNLVEGYPISKAEDVNLLITEKGNFKVIEDIMKISGIGEKLYDKIKNMITV